MRCPIVLSGAQQELEGKLSLESVKTRHEGAARHAPLGQFPVTPDHSLRPFPYGEGPATRCSALLWSCD